MFAKELTLVSKLRYFITAIVKAVKESIKESIKEFVMESVMVFQTSLKPGLIIIKDH